MPEEVSDILFGSAPKRVIRKKVRSGNDVYEELSIPTGLSGNAPIQIRASNNPVKMDEGLEDALFGSDAEWSTSGMSKADVSVGYAKGSYKIKPTTRSMKALDKKMDGILYGDEVKQKRPVRQQGGVKVNVGEVYGLSISSNPKKNPGAYGAYGLSKPSMKALDKKMDGILYGDEVTQTSAKKRPVHQQVDVSVGEVSGLYTPPEKNFGAGAYTDSKPSMKSLDKKMDSILYGNEVKHTSTSVRKRPVHQQVDKDVSDVYGLSRSSDLKKKPGAYGAYTASKPSMKALDKKMDDIMYGNEVKAVKSKTHTKKQNNNIGYTALSISRHQQPADKGMADIYGTYNVQPAHKKNPSASPHETPSMKKLDKEMDGILYGNELTHSIEKKKRIKRITGI